MELFILRHKYFIYPYQSMTGDFTINPTIKRTKYHLLSIIIGRIILFAQVIYSGGQHFAVQTSEHSQIG